METEKELNERIESHNKAYIDFLSDVLHDRKKDSIFLKVLLLISICINIILCFFNFRTSIHCQDIISENAEKSEQRMYDFISDYDFDTTYNLDSLMNDNNSGNINVTRN